MLGYASVHDSRFGEYLHRRVKLTGTGLKRAEIYACGWSLSKPDHTAHFIRATTRRLSQQGGTNDWVRNLAHILRLRDGATQEITSKDGHKLCKQLIRIFRRERERRNAKYIFRSSCLSIVYLLRRRAYDDDFLDPDSALAEEIKDEFRQAIHDERSGDLDFIRGRFNLATELNRLIDYIDRHGHGLPGMTISG